MWSQSWLVPQNSSANMASLQDGSPVVSMNKYIGADPSPDMGIGGQSIFLNHKGPNQLTIVLNVDGSYEWHRVNIYNDGSNTLRSLHTDSLGNVFTGWTKYSSAGQLRWSVVLSGYYAARMNAATVTTDGRLVVNKAFEVGSVDGHDLGSDPVPGTGSISSYLLLFSP